MTQVEESTNIRNKLFLILAINTGVNR
jgi:hypothetical protein